MSQTLRDPPKNHKKEMACNDLQLKNTSHYNKDR
uniref:Uncharacterized protein n=1 Tax=Rhizophora mucronata TaxID=61149 RepID=A0A2P2Q4V4_RHIMU